MHYDTGVKEVTSTRRSNSVRRPSSGVRRPGGAGSETECHHRTTEDPERVEPARGQREGIVSLRFGLPTCGRRGESFACVHHCTKII